MKVIGIDLSLASTGYALVEAGAVVELGTVKTAAPKPPSIQATVDRLRRISVYLSSQVYMWEPDLIVIEAPSYGSKFGSQHERAGLWWITATELSPLGDIGTVSPQGRAKYGTGKGNAAKSEVFARVKVNYADLLPYPLRNNDEADALLLAAMGARRLGVPIVGEQVTERQLEAVEAASWPVMAA